MVMEAGSRERERGRHGVGGWCRATFCGGLNKTAFDLNGNRERCGRLLVLRYQPIFSKGEKRERHTIKVAAGAMSARKRLCLPALILRPFGFFCVTLIDLIER